MVDTLCITWYAVKLRKFLCLTFFKVFPQFRWENHEKDQRSVEADEYQPFSYVCCTIEQEIKTREKLKMHERHIKIFETFWIKIVVMDLELVTPGGFDIRHGYLWHLN